VTAEERMLRFFGFLAIMAAAAFSACNTADSSGPGDEVCSGQCDIDSDCGSNFACVMVTCAGCVVTTCGVCSSKTNIACTDGGSECGAGAICDVAEGICVLDGLCTSDSVCGVGLSCAGDGTCVPDDCADGGAWSEAGAGDAG
jgi:hypothetical protein